MNLYITCKSLAEISKEESSTIIVYPQESRAGQEIAHAAVSHASKPLVKRKKVSTIKPANK